jgi:uncharacterized protein (TIGR02300 family)
MGFPRGAAVGSAAELMRRTVLRRSGGVKGADARGLEIADLMLICGRPSPSIAKDFNLSKPELGIKHLCGNCGAKFYDLNKDTIACPTCETAFVIPTPVTRRAPTGAARMRPQPFAARAPEPAEEAATSVVPPAEFEQAKSEAETSEEEIGIGANHDDAILIDADEEEDDIKKPEEI